ncbi:MAG: DUF2062 domain-containing protein [Nitrospirae bacterium]|nr:DUF2062 domain-containing protein [Nitrospirota bacterium]
MAFRDKLKQILYINDTPHHIAISFAFGIFMGITPLFGLHAIGTIFLAWLFRLNKLVAIAGAAILNPWTVVPIYSFSLWLGAKLMGLKHILPDINWSHITITSFIEKLSPLILPLVVGTLLLGIVCSAASYFIIRNLVIRYRKSTHAA